MKKRITPVVLAVTGLLLFSMACAIGTPSANPMDATVTALSISVAGTATREANKSSNGESGNSLATAQAEVTQRAGLAAATQTAYAASHSADQQATASAEAPVVAELPRYNVDPKAGHVAFLHPPVKIDITGYQQNGYANDFPGTTARDFVYATDITWNTQYGTSGCGLMFRSNGDKNKPSQYMVITTRFANGYAGFMATDQGDMANLQAFYPGQKDKSFQWLNDKTNRLAVVAIGSIIQIFTNGALVGEVDVTKDPPPLVLPNKPIAPIDKNNQALIDDYKDQLAQYDGEVKQLQQQYSTAMVNSKNKKAIFTDGFVGFIAVSESGHTVCNFSNSWLWIIEK